MQRRKMTVLATVAALAVVPATAALAKGGGNTGSPKQEVINVNANSTTITEGSTKQVWVTRSGDLTCALDIDYTTADGNSSTAANNATSADGDYTPHSGTLHMNAKATSTSTKVTVNALDDGVIDPGESYRFLIGPIHTTCSVPVALKSSTEALPITDSDDTDGDGVANGSDLCPGTPAGSTVDSDGCTAAQRAASTTIDDDADGVANGSDLCPNTASGATVDTNGCSADQRDSDGDGVSDATDNCVFSANADQRDFDGDGVGDVCDSDADGDGVADTSDNTGTTSTIFIGGNAVNTHADNIKYASNFCTVSGAFTGLGQSVGDSQAEYISGNISDSAGHLSYTSTYANGYHYTVTVADGDFDPVTGNYSGTGLDSGGTSFDVTGNFSGLPVC